MKRLLSLLALGIVSFSFGQQSSGLIKAEIIDGHIFIKAKINHQPVRLAVDSGAQMNALVPDAAKRLGIASLQKVNAVGVGSKPIDAYIGRADLIEVGKSGSVGEPVVVIPLPPELECDGLVGYGFLSHFVTTIDYAGGTIRFDKPGDFTEPTNATQLPIQFESGIPGVQGTIEGCTGLFSIDTGANGSLALFGPFVERNKLREKFPKRIATVTGAGVGGVAMGEVVRSKSFNIGDVTIPNLVVNLSTQTSGAFANKQRVGNISADVLSRFTVSLDYPGKRLFLTKNQNFGKPSEWNRAGFFISYATGKPKIVWVLKNTPAEIAGVQLGDELVEWRGKAVKEYKPNELKADLRGPEGQKIQFKVKRGSEIKTIEVQLKELLG